MVTYSAKNVLMPTSVLSNLLDEWVQTDIVSDTEEGYQATEDET